VRLCSYWICRWGRWDDRSGGVSRRWQRSLKQQLEFGLV